MVFNTINNTETGWWASQEKLVQLVITSYNNQEAGVKKAEPFHDKATMCHLAHRPMEHVQDSMKQG